MNDSTSLQNLNDIMMPDAVGWWPLAPGWFVTAAVLSIIGLWAAWRWWRKWQTDGYRRAALRSLKSLRTVGDRNALLQIPELIKRAAISCWPRSDVAALSGREWHKFLDRSSASHHFCTEAGVLLDRLAYGDSSALDMGETESAALFAAVEFWLKRHRKDLALAEPC